MVTLSDWERVGFSIAFTSVAKETGVTDTEKGSVFAALFSGDALTQVPVFFFTHLTQNTSVSTLLYEM